MMQALLDTCALLSMYSIIAIGFHLVRCVTKQYYFAYGASIVVAPATSYILSKTIHCSVPIAIVGGICASALVALLVYILLLQNMHQRGHALRALLTSIAVAAAIEQCVAVAVGSEPRGLHWWQPSEGWRVADGYLTPLQAIIIVVATMLLGVCSLIIRYTAFGLWFRAIADDLEVARVLHVRIRRTVGVVFCWAGATGGIAGVFLGLANGLWPNMWLKPLLMGTAASVLAGSTWSVRNIVIGATVVAAAERIVASLLPFRWQDALILLIAVAALVVRGQRRMRTEVCVIE